MEQDIPSRSVTTTQIIKLARFGILWTLGLAVLLLVADFVGKGWQFGDLRFLSERILVTFVCAVAAEVVAAIVSVTFLALWK
jgi:hypothetical protein